MVALESKYALKVSCFFLELSQNEIMSYQNEIMSNLLHLNNVFKILGTGTCNFLDG